MNTYGMIAVTAIVFGTLAQGQAASPYQAVQRGNTLYQEERYDEALQQYDAAGQALPETAEISFNQGNAYYKQGDYAQALAAYASALHAGDRQLESRILYNLGNVEYQQALQTQHNLPDALPHLRSAMTYYRKSLQLDPERSAARYNLELAMRLRHQLLQREQQRASDPGQDRQQPKQPGQPAANRKRESPSQDAPQDEQQSPGQQAGQASQTQATPDSGSAGTRQITAPPELSPEEAERRLDVIRQRAREIDQLRDQWRRARMRDARVDKYW